ATAGYLNAAFGAGGVLGVAVTVALVGRRRLAPSLLMAVALWAAALAVLAAAPSTLAAFALLAVAGIGRTTLDVAGRTLLQRIARLRALPIFSPLAAPALEGLVRALEPVEAIAGTAVNSEGEPGDRFYVVADGELDVSVGGEYVGMLERGDCFGEITLLRDVP